MKPRRRLPDIRRPIFTYDKKPGRIRSVLAVLLIATVMAEILARWAELQGGFAP